MDEPQPARHPFDRLRARGLLLQLVLAALLAIGMLLVLRPGGAGQPAPQELRIATMVLYAVGSLLLFVRGRIARIDWRQLFGGPPTRDLLPLLLVVVPVALLTVAAAIASYIPLSYLAPGFVERTLLGDRAIFEATGLAAWLELVAISVVAAPFMEELLFRGILLQRWARRWGTVTGVVASSALFALMHGEWLGHFLFGVAMAALYLRTRRLWMPIAAHALSNGVLMLFALPEALHARPPVRTTLAQLRGQWPIGLLAFAAGVALLWWYLARWWPDDDWRRVLRGTVPYDAARVTAAPPTIGSWADSISTS